MTEECFLISSNLKELFHDILSYFSDEQSYFRIEGDLKIIVY